jgi:DNA polymerase sigma
MKHLRSNRGRFLHHRVGRIELIPAKVPILKLAVKEPNKTDILEIDINCNNVAGIYNSHLLHYYARYVNWLF